MSAINVPNPDGENGQPQRAPRGLPFGERQQMMQQQAAAPTQRERPTERPQGGGSAPRGMVQGAFRPQEGPRAPRRPVQASQPSQEQNDPDLLMRAIFRAFPHPDIERLLTRRNG